MKILASAQLTGAVSQVSPAAGTLLLAGLEIQMEHGAVVRAGDFVEVEARLTSAGEWVGRIKAHYLAPGVPADAIDHESAQAGAAATATTTSAEPMQQAQSAGEGHATGNSPAVPGTAAQATPPAPAGVAGGSRASRFGGGRSAPAAQHGTPSAATQAHGRPPFNPSSADKAVSY